MRGSIILQRKKEYVYFLTLTGRSNNAKSDSYYIVLSNDEGISFEEVDRKFWSGTYTNENLFYIVERGAVD